MTNEAIPAWEYFTVVLEANVDIAPVPTRDEIPLEAHPKYSPYTLIPQLNRYGAQGWELVSMEAVILGKNHDVVHPANGPGSWGREYLCSFKRRLAV